MTRAGLRSGMMFFEYMKGTKTRTEGADDAHAGTCARVFVGGEGEERKEEEGA